MATEAGHDFVEYQQRTDVLRRPSKVAQELGRLQFGSAALHRLHHHGSQLIAQCRDHLECSWIAIVEHHDVLDGAVRNPRGRRVRSKFASSDTAANQHFIEVAVVSAAKHHDRVSPRVGSRASDRSLHRL